jgi:CubicO group peptidase (beta-lactamase class C family)
MTENQLDERVRSAAGTNVPGVAVIVVGAEGVRARSAVGSADLISRRSMATNSAFPWFSMTKIATATTAIRLAERCVLELDAPVCSLVPVMRVLRPAPWAAQITVRHLLQHTAGFPNPIPLTWIHPADQPGPDPDAFLERLLAKHSRLRFQPGARSSYSNLGPLVLGSAITQATRASFQSVVQDEVLEPLRMSSTAFTFSLENNAAIGYHTRYSPMRLLLPRWVTGPSAGRWISFRRFLVDGAPYGGLIGSAEDAARFLRMHLRDGELDGLRIISAEAATQMRLVNARGKRFDLGLGWFVPAHQRSADPAFVEHLGGGAGFFNVMRIYPTRGVGVVVMGNATKYDVNAVASLALNFHS